MSALILARRESLAACFAKLEACRERARVLDELADRHEGLSESTRRMLSRQIPGSLGLLAERVEASPAIAGLVDAAVGAVAGHLLVESSEDLIAWLAAATPDCVAGGGRRPPRR